MQNGFSRGVHSGANEYVYRDAVDVDYFMEGLMLLLLGYYPIKVLHCQVSMNYSQWDDPIVHQIEGFPPVKRQDFVDTRVLALCRRRMILTRVKRLGAIITASATPFSTTAILQVGANRNPL